MKVLPLALMVLFAFPALGQYEGAFTPSPFLDTIPSEIYGALKKRLEADKRNVTTRGREGEYLRTLYEQRFRYVVDNFNEDYFIIDHPLTTYLGHVADRIYDANPGLSHDLNVYAFRSAVPNAVSFGEGTIAIMLGLLERLETEDQVAFILCHEFAHYYARHSDRNFAQLAALNYDKDLKHKINDIRKSPYGQYAKLKALFHNLDLSLTRHSRKSEFEADSLGLTYYLNTGYDVDAPLRVMEILGNADEGMCRYNIDFRKFFDSKDFPFKESWGAYQKSNIIYASLKDNDSDTLHTHPNTRRRSERLERLIQVAAANATDLMKAASFKKLAHLASLEIISSHYHFRQYGKALFTSLILADSFPYDPYPQAMIAKSLYQLYKAQKAHNLDKVLELPDPRFDENYNRFLTFIHKLRLHEVANLAYEYATSRPAPFYTNEEMIHALWQCSSFEFSRVDNGKVALEYQQLYPEGKYIEEMKDQ